MLNRPGENPDCNDLISLWEWGVLGCYWGNYKGDYIENEEKLDKKVKNLMQLVEYVLITDTVRSVMRVCDLSVALLTSCHFSTVRFAGRRGGSLLIACNQQP